jgi:hypothetical protein
LKFRNCIYIETEIHLYRKKYKETHLYRWKSLKYIYIDNEVHLYRERGTFI